MSTATSLPVELRLRPVRIGLLVAPHDQEALSRWFRLNTILWGGVFNPIIPLADKTPEVWRASAGTDDGLMMARAYLRYFEPDILVEAEPGLAARLLKPNPTGKPWSHVVGLDAFVSEHGRIAAGLTTDYGYTTRYRREAQFVMRDPKTWIVAGEDPLGVGELAWGAFPDVPAVDEVERTYREAFKPQTIEASPATWLEHYTQNRIAPLAMSYEGLEVLADPDAVARIFVFDPLNPLDRIDVWNARLFSLGVLPVPAGWVPELAEFLRKAAREGRPFAPGDFYSRPYPMTVEFSESLSPAQVEALVVDHFTDAHGAPDFAFVFSRPTVPLRADAPKLHRASGGTRALKLELDERGSGQMPSVAPPFETIDAVGDHLWANVLTFGHLGFDNQTATVFPSNETDRGFPRLREIWGQTVVSREGLVLFGHGYAGDHYLTLPSQRAALMEWLARQGVSAKPSGAGAIAQEMLRALGGPWGAAVVSEKQVLELLNKMAVSQVSVDAEGQEELRHFDGKTARTKQWRSLLQQLKGRAGYDFDESVFVDRNMLRLGLTADCAYCGQSNWYPLDRFGYELPCDRCLRTYKVSEAISQSDAWRYRVIGSFAVPNYADGAYAVALTLRFLTLLVAQDVEASYSTALELRWDDKIVESDFLLWWRRAARDGFGPDTRLILGEAKSFAINAINGDTIKSLTALAERFPEAAIVVAKLADGYSPQEKALLNGFRDGLRAVGREALLIVLTGRELLARERMTSRWLDGSDRHKALADSLLNPTLEALSAATCAVYLESEDGEVR